MLHMLFLLSDFVVIIVITIVSIVVIIIVFVIVVVVVVVVVVVIVVSLLKFFSAQMQPFHCKFYLLCTKHYIAVLPISFCSIHHEV